VDKLDKMLNERYEDGASSGAKCACGEELITAFRQMPSGRILATAACDADVESVLNGQPPEHDVTIGLKNYPGAHQLLNGL
jgi:hypothetical protein